MTFAKYGSYCLCAGLALVMGSARPAVAADAAPASTTPTLDMADELSLEKLEQRIFQTPRFQKQLKAGEDLYRQNRLAKLPDGAAKLKNAVRAIALSAIQDTISDDPARPKIMWTSNAAHSWSGVSVPGSGYGIDNPDNFYRYIAIDGDSHYEISGKRTGPGPAQESFVLYSAIPGTGGKNVEGAPIIGTISDKDIDYAADGSFTFKIDGDDAPGARNHLKTKSGAKLLIIRDTLADWTKQVPNRLSVKRLSGPAGGPAPSEDQMADRAAAILAAVLPFWLDYFEFNDYKNPANSVFAPFARGGGWGFATGGWYDLKDDEAFVVTIKPLSALYLGFQTTDPWGVAPDYIHYTSSLNATQAKPNADGTYTYVMAAKDPGAWNWLNTEGMHSGMFTVRWQGLPASVTSAADAIQKTEVVKIAELKKALPADAAWVTPAERKKQQADRAASYALRLAN